MDKNLTITSTGINNLLSCEDTAHQFTAHICTNAESQEIKFMPKFISSTMYQYKNSLIYNIKLFFPSKSNIFYDEAQWIKKQCKDLSSKIQAISTQVMSSQYFVKIISSPWSINTLKKFLFVENLLKITKKWTKLNKKSSNCTKSFTTVNQSHNYKEKLSSNIFLKSKGNLSCIIIL